MKYTNVLINLRLEAEEPRTVDALGEVLLALNKIDLKPGETLNVDVKIEVERLIP